MANEIANKIQEPVNREVVNSIKLIKFHIDPKMVFHRIRISKDNNNIITITHFYHVVDNTNDADNNTNDINYSDLEEYIKNSRNYSISNRPYNDINMTDNYNDEDSVAKLTPNFTEVDKISINTFKITNCRVRTKTKITAP